MYFLYDEVLRMMLFITMPTMRIIMKKVWMLTTIVIMTMMMRLNGKSVDEDEEDDGNGRSCYHR